MVIQHLQPQGPHGRDAADFAGAIADNEHDLAGALFYQRFIIERAVLAPHVFYRFTRITFFFLPKTLESYVFQNFTFPVQSNIQKVSVFPVMAKIKR